MPPQPVYFFWAVSPPALSCKQPSASPSHQPTLHLSSTCYKYVTNAGHAATAKRAFLGGIASGAFLQAALSLAITAWGRHLVALFTNDPAVVASCCTVLPLLAGLVFFDGVNAVVGGCLRGAGRQMLGAGINFIG
jgi:MATE family multidrug resistance protein